MRKMCILLSYILLLSALSACKNPKDEFIAPVNAYYCVKDVTYNAFDGVIRAEERESASYYNNLTAYLRSYLLGPNSPELTSPFPGDVYLVSCEIQDYVAKVTLSNQFSKLNGVRLTTACSALLLTVHDFSGVETLRICAKDAQLDGRAELVIDLDDIVFIDTVEQQ